MRAFDRDGLIRTDDPEMIRVLKTAENVAASRATILLQGESGTGKELLARFIHARSSRAQKRFVAINCAAVPEGLLESELFGHERGAFTGAHQLKPGKFELAHEGTLLLDEVSEMPLLLQAKLLRVLQEGEIERLGGQQTLRVNVRVVATTNRDLGSMVRRGEFREDLYYRLNVVPLRIPALRERPRDIEGLARFFMEVSNHMNMRSVREISLDAMDKLKSWRWPGNVRELENVIERAVLFANGERIEPSHIEIQGVNETDSTESASHGTTSTVGMTVGPGLTVAEIERLLIMKTLEYTEQNRTKAAKLLGISIRTLRNKLHEYGVTHG
ncbi:MAG: sigma-54 dependent transcriptional regulator [Bdellovibrionales bacterium]|jgi:two-component system response regulator FlrC|nr:sigma-54 dependent transcriptional regulator [Bdellovibrionales bacterium]